MKCQPTTEMAFDDFDFVRDETLCKCGEQLANIPNDPEVPFAKTQRSKETTPNDIAEVRRIFDAIDDSVRDVLGIVSLS